MARETKVGLLAGLAFIICFAVILANRGANGPPGLANSFLPEGGLELPKLVQRNQAATGEPAANAIRNRNRQPVRQPVQEPTANQVTPYGMRTEVPQYAVNNPAPTPGTQLPPATNPEPPQRTPEYSIAQNTRPVDAPYATGVNPDSARAIPSPTRLDAALRNEAQVPMTATTASSPEPVVPPRRVALNEPGSVTQNTTQPSTPDQGTPYTVKASDTLSSIASAHYGTKSKQAVETIYDANRGVLTDINSVKLGTVLTIPKLAGAAEKSQPIEKSPPPTKAPQTPEKAAEAKGKSSDKPTADKKSADKTPVKKVAETLADGEKNPKNFQWYQVKKNDRLASIAREQLGDAGRWQEVYELNKDKFPDPQKIREGVRIKLPAPARVASAGKEKGH